ncbi:SDR family NAD(P)-dependent oxidoreductase [Aquimarina sp. W85]|uniref:SDR family NAD(P)-dependent oxidoreductase n=1 Tax=Aquimarina rhodophyticola TaxID=3342246 RepID=UPI00366CF903
MHKHILITGSTDGIGKLTALELAKEGHSIYVHGRDEAKLNATITTLKKTANNPNIKGYVADFSDLNAVGKMANQIKRDVPALDVLINNAGVFKTKNTLTKSRLDYRFTVNYLAPYHLTNVLLPNLKSAKSPRILNLSSAAQSSIISGVMNGDVIAHVNEAYAQSKLALTMWSFNLAQQETSIIVIAVNPGSLLNTKMVAEAYGHHWSPAKKGADILYSLAIDTRHASSSGRYFDNDKGYYDDAHPDVYDKEKRKELLIKTDKLLSALGFS